MAHKDTLTLYEDLIASGAPEAQAKIQAHQMGDLADEMGSRYNELNAKLDLSLQGLRKDLMWMKIIGGAMTLAFMSNFFK